MQLLFASSNPHKIKEVRAVLRSLGIDVVGLVDVGEMGPEPEEDGETFADNARIKAVYYAKITGRWCLADDSGLDVDALEGEPGVHSARWAGTGESRPERDDANNKKLLEALAGLPREQRTARFVCTMCLAEPDGNVVAETRGVFEGVIGDEPRGSNGFGYDPLFILPQRGCTSAELPPEEKNALSHRGEAVRKMVEKIGTSTYFRRK